MEWLIAAGVAAGSAALTLTLRRLWSMWRGSGQLSEEELGILVELLHLHIRLVRLPPGREALFLAATERVWLGALQAHGQRLSVIQEGPQFKRLGDTPLDPQDWAHQAASLLEANNFRWLSRAEALGLGLHGKGEHLLFELKGATRCNYHLLELPRLSKARKTIYARYFRSLYALVWEARAIQGAAHGQRQQTEALQAKNLRFWRVATALDHNLRGALTPLLANLELLGAAVNREASPAALATMVGEDLLPGVGVARDLLASFRQTLSVLAEDEMDAPLQALDLANLFERDFAAWLERQATLHPAVSIHWEIPEGLLILASEIGFFQVVWNVLRNAVRLTSQGEVVVSAVQAVDGLVHLRVRDSGPGLSSDELHQIGQYAFRGGSSLEKEGQGVGLWSAYMFMAKMGGRIDVESTLGVGSTFSIGFRKAG